MKNKKGIIILCVAAILVALLVGFLVKGRGNPEIKRILCNNSWKANVKVDGKDALLFLYFDNNTYHGTLALNYGTQQVKENGQYYIEDGYIRLRPHGHSYLDDLLLRYNYDSKTNRLTLYCGSSQFWTN